MSILDKMTELFSTPKSLPAPSEQEIGWESSLIHTIKDFGKFNPDALMSSKGPLIYKKMMQDEQVKAALRFKQYAVVSREWFFDVGTDDEGHPKPEHEDMARFFEFMINQIKGSFKEKLIGILSALQNGFSISEKVMSPISWEGREMWGIKDIKLRPFETFLNGIHIDQHGNILGFAQNVGGGVGGKGIEIPMDRIIHYVHQADIDAHYGESDLRAAYRAWWSKDIDIKFWNIHLERHASGFIWAKVQPGLTTTQKTNLQSLIKNISARMGAVVPDKVDLNAMQPMRTDAFEQAIITHNKAISKAILVPNLLGLSEQGDTGSFSQANVHLKAFFWILDAISGQLSEILNEDLFRPLALYNFGTEDFPRFTFEPVSDDEKRELAKSWSELISKGAVTKSDADEAQTRRLMGYPEKSEAEEVEIEDEDEDEEDFPQDFFPSEPGTLPDNEPFIKSLSDERQSQVRKEMQEKPWLKRMDFAKLDESFTDQTNSFSMDMAEVMAEVRASFERQIAVMFGVKSGANIDPSKLDSIRIPKKLQTQLRKVIRKNLERAMVIANQTARRELPKKMKATIPIAPGLDTTQAQNFLTSRALRGATNLAQRTVDALINVLHNSIKYDKTLRQTIVAMATDTDIMAVLPEVDSIGRAVNVPSRLETIARTNITEATNLSRVALFGSPEFQGFVVAMEYSAILDERTTEICEHLHGKIFKDWADLTPPNHFNCRSVLVPVTVVDDWDGKESSPATKQPQKGFA